jgi:hypothetical protein
MRTLFRAAALIALVTLPGLAGGSAQAAVKPHAASGAVHIVLVRSPLFGDDGTGSLFYGGRRYRLAVSGIDTRGLGSAGVHLSGSASHLRSVSRIAGSYFPSSGAAAVIGAEKSVRLKNENGVVLELQGTRMDADFSLDISGITLRGLGWQAE